MAVAEFSVKQLSQLTSTINDDLFEALLKCNYEPLYTSIFNFNFEQWHSSTLNQVEFRKILLSTCESQANYPVVTSISFLTD